MPRVWGMSGLEKIRVVKEASMLTMRIMKTPDGLCEKQPRSSTYYENILPMTIGNKIINNLI